MFRKQLSLLMGVSTTLLFNIQNPAVAASNDWQIDPSNSKIEFAIKNMGFNVSGKMTGVSGTVKYDAKDIQDSWVRAQIDPTSIDTGIGVRDHHLRSKDFFNVANFPQIEFYSTKIVPQSSGSFDVIGTLTMHGIMKQVTLHVQPLSQWQEKSGSPRHVSATANTRLNRKDFSVGGLTAVTIGNSVDVALKIDLRPE